MAIDMASVYAERFRQNPNALRAAVMGQSPDPKLDSYTALNALRLIKEADMMAMAAQAQQPTSSPSILAETMAPPTPPQGMGAPVGQMPQGQMPQGMPPQGQMPQGMPPQQAPVMQASGGLAGMPISEEEYAAGGIVAFSGPTEENNYSLVSDLTVPPGTPRSEEESGLYPNEVADGGGNAGLQAMAFRDSQETRNLIKNLTRGTTTAEEDDAATERYMRQMEKFGGPDIYKAAMDKVTEREGARGKNKSQGEGLALLAAAGAILEGNTLARGAAKAFPVFAKEMGEVQRADIAEQRSIEAMRFALSDAQRKERMGDLRGAQAAREAARKEKINAATFELQKAQALATLDARALAATRTNAKGTGSGPKLAEQLAAAEVEYRKNPTPENLKVLEGLSSAASKMKTSFSTSVSDIPAGGPKDVNTKAGLTTKQNEAVVKGMAAWEDSTEAYKAKKDGTYATKKVAKETDLRRQASQGVFDGKGGDDTPTAAPGTVYLNYDANGKRIK